MYHRPATKIYQTTSNPLQAILGYFQSVALHLTVVFRKGIFAPDR